MTDNVVPFNRRVAPATWSDGRVQTECDDVVHLFASVPGRCQCGERLWTSLDETAPAEDGDPQPKETGSCSPPAA